MKFERPDPTQELFDAEYEEEWTDEVFGRDDGHEDDDGERYYDDISGVESSKSLVLEARQKELDWVHDIKLYDKVPRQHAIDKGIKPITVRWVDVNKGDDNHMNIRSRLVGREPKRQNQRSASSPRTV